MRKVIKATWLPLIGLSVFCVVILSVHGGIDGRNKQQQQPDIETSHFPTAEYGLTLSDPKERARWQAKSRKYNTKHAARINESLDQIFQIVDWDSGLPAFPVAQSAAIVIGQITDTRAYLSEDGTNIYSEFSIQVDEILKNDFLNPLTTGVSLIAEREGGRVRFPSGKIITARVNHQNMPRTGRRYVFFLRRTISTESDSDGIHLLTAYELREGRVFPLDNVLEGHPISQYKGKTDQEFLTELRAVIAKAD
jgi:hypothetical protein